ncbi:MAG: hypothetical protein ACXIVF_15310 [Rhizobiaceae bacterium]
MIALLASRLGVLGAIALAALIFWEGVPLVRDVPLIRHVPVVGPVVDDIALGRIGRAERRGRVDGAAAERAAWEEAHRRLRAEMERQRREAQAEIDRIERDYLAARTADQLRWHGQLEAAIATHMETEDARDDSCPARPAIPRGLSRVLNDIGR